MTASKAWWKAAIVAARKAGTAQGRSAASWYEPGSWALALRGMEDGDPEVLDGLPLLDLSGQWADGATEGFVLSAIAHEMADLGYGLDEDLLDPEERDELIDAFRDAHDMEVQTECERRARANT